MPKGFKRKKNAGVGVDFKRAKLKVGKKLPQAQNATDTNVVARTINLPNQSITVDKTGAVVTQRNLTLKDLMGQCGHYSERVRLDALRGLTELLQAAPEEGRRHAAAVVATVSERAADPDATCRAALRDLLQRALLPALGAEGLQPFVPVLMGHVTAAMTHMAEPIRRDALSLLAVVMDWRGDLVAANYLTQVLQHFSDALARPSRGGSLKAGSLAALQSVLSGLRTFLEKAAKQQAVSPAAAAAAAPATPSQQQTAVLAWQRCRWNAPSSNTNATALPSYTEAAVDDGSTNESAAASLESSPEGRAARRVLELLGDAWVECCPAELSARPELGPAKAAATVLQCCNLMLERWGPELAGPLMAASYGGAGKSGNFAATLVDRIVSYFPVPAPAVAPTAGVREELMAVNVAAAKLLVTFMPQAIAAQHGQQYSSHQQQRQQQQQQQHASAVWVAALLDWLQGVMSTAAVLPTAEDDVTGVASGGVAAARCAPEATEEEIETEKQPQKGKKKRRLEKQHGRGGDGVPAAVYGAALGAVADCLALLPQPRRLELLAAAWALWERSPVKSAPRAKALDFFAALLASPALPGAPSLIPSEEAARWAAAMPKFLWELGAHSQQTPNPPPASHLQPVAAPSDAAFSTALRLLLNAARFAPAYGVATGTDPMRDALSGLAPQLTPLFGFLRPAEPKSGSGKTSSDKSGVTAQKFVVGPLAAVSPSTQRLAVDLVCHLPGIHASILQTTALIALGAGAYPVDLCLRLIEVAASKAEEADSAAFWGVLLSLISGRSQAGVEREAEESAEGWRRHEAVAGAGVRAALSAVGPEATVQVVTALGPGLLRVWQSSAPNAAQEKEESEEGDCSEAARPLYGLLSLYRAAVLAAGVGEDAAAAAAFLAGCGEVKGALPAAAAAFVRACAANGSAMSAEAAAKLVVDVVATAPTELLPPALAAATPSHQKKLCSFACLQACLVLLIEIAKSPKLESALVEQAGAEAAAAAVASVGEQLSSRAAAAQEKYKELQPLHQQALALVSQKLGKDLL